MVDLIYRDGSKKSQTRWFTDPQGHYAGLPANATLQQAMAVTTSGIVPIEQLVDDGTRYFSRINNMYYHDPHMPPATARVIPSPNFTSSNTPPDTLWPFIGLHMTMVNMPGTPAGVIVLRDVRGDERTDYWIDSSHDYICVRRIWQKKTDGQWLNRRVEILDALKRLPDGQWYASQDTFEDYGRSVHEGNPTTEVKAIDLKVLKPEEIPPGTFDGQKLLQGAKVETY